MIEPTAKQLNYWLSRFVVEVRHEYSKPYPPASINQILSGLYQFSKSSCPTGTFCPNFMDWKDVRFLDLTGTIQVLFHELRTEGVGALVKHAAIVTPVEENKLWNLKVLGVHNPLALLRVVFFTWVRRFAFEVGRSSVGLNTLSSNVHTILITTCLWKTGQKSLGSEYKRRK